MSTFPSCLLALSLIPFFPALGAAEDGKWSGQMAIETRLFPESAAFAGQKGVQLSLSLQPEYYQAWEGGDQSVTFVPFARLDGMDPERTHGDIRELTWVKVAEDWELRLGVRKVFWGVTESQHLVDIINQTDTLESIDGEEKLGQPMVNLSLNRDYGTFDFFLLPYFRERHYPGHHGRLRTAIRIDDDQARYESSAKEHHIDWAARWFHTLGDWDLGLSHFSGTDRAPTFSTGNDGNGNTVLIPYYAQLDQTGLDIQATKDAWLWKLEVISQRRLNDRHTATTGGFEYTFVGVWDSDADLGLIVEHLFDDRGEAAPTAMENDLMVGLRLTINDENSTDLLIGSILDLNRHQYLISVEGSRRLMQDWKVSIEGRLFVDMPKTDPLYSLQRDSFLQIELARYF